MKTIVIIICLILICLIVAVIYDFIASRERNRKNFGSDFLFDTIDKGSNASNNRTLDEHNLANFTFSERPMPVKLKFLNFKQKNR